MGDRPEKSDQYFHRNTGIISRVFTRPGSNELIARFVVIKQNIDVSIFDRSALEFLHDEFIHKLREEKYKIFQPMEPYENKIPKVVVTKSEDANDQDGGAERNPESSVIQMITLETGIGNDPKIEDSFIDSVIAEQCSANWARTTYEERLMSSQAFAATKTTFYSTFYTEDKPPPQAEAEETKTPENCPPWVRVPQTQSAPEFWDVDVNNFSMLDEAALVDSEYKPAEPKWLVDAANRAKKSEPTVKKYTCFYKDAKFKWDVYDSEITREWREIQSGTKLGCQ